MWQSKTGNMETDDIVLVYAGDNMLFNTQVGKYSS